MTGLVPRLVLLHKGCIKHPASCWFFYACDSAHPNYGGLDWAASAGRFLCDGRTNPIQFTTQRLVPFRGELYVEITKGGLMPNQITVPFHG